MREGNLVNLIVGIMLICCSAYWVNAEDPYRYFTFQVTYGTRAPLGVKQKVPLFLIFFAFTNQILFFFYFIIYFWKMLIQVYLLFKFIKSKNFFYNFLINFLL